MNMVYCTDVKYRTLGELLVLVFVQFEIKMPSFLARRHLFLNHIKLSLVLLAADFLKSELHRSLLYSSLLW